MKKNVYESAYRSEDLQYILASCLHMPTVPVMGVGKEGRTVIGPWGYLNKKLPFIELP